LDTLKNKGNQSGFPFEPYPAFTIGQMIIPGSNYWNMGFGLEKEEVKSDKEGMEIMKTLGRNMAWLMKRII